MEGERLSQVEGIIAGSPGGGGGLGVVGLSGGKVQKFMRGKGFGDVVD